MLVLRIAIVLGLLFLLLRWWLKTPQTPGEPEAFEATARCHECGLVLPRAEAHHHDGHDYCQQHQPSEE